MDALPIEHIIAHSSQSDDSNFVADINIETTS